MASLVSGLTLLIVGVLLNGARDKDKARDDKVNKIAEKVGALELQMVKELASREDVEALVTRIDSMDKTLTQVRDMVIRMDERGKIHDRRE
jgi:vacuolar-type H+-ATPase subunit C/Vma6